MESIKAFLDEPTMKQLDHWRGTRKPAVSRHEAIQLLLKDSLSVYSKEIVRQGRRIKLQLPDPVHLGAIYALEQVHGFGPVKFRTMVEQRVVPRDVLENPSQLSLPGVVGTRIVQAIESLPNSTIVNCMDRAHRQVEVAQSHSASILVIGDADYPKRIYDHNPVPVLYIRGDTSILHAANTTAVVGSRDIREPYLSQTIMLTQTLAEVERVHVSGFALGADSVGHEAVVNVGGKTICVMPCGIDRLFPPENRALREKLLVDPNVVFVSEFGFGQGASTLRLRKRNKLIVALADEVFVAQSTLNGGAMNAYRFSLEQRKPVGTFRSDLTEETEGNALIESDGENTQRGGISFDLDERVSHYIKCNKQVSSLI
ncbi:MAG: DNA-processing protein DprA [Gammaproteobacteria bacterium]|nr:DNA-processing protein DprA [Gammaproteobacteria bacterium]MDE0251290.1 DNA-processing protein DprA [Gammaproteobacteria bacterium]MDE0402025.1 DNA-processing protein DprA [Gammaproteobacteria bacterium]